MDYQLIDNKEAKRFEFQIEDHVAFIDYILAKGNIYLTHTEVPTALEGKGIASALVLAVFKVIEQESWSLIPLCPFVATYIKRHPEWKKLVYRGINVD
jgi:predicted GNAT family acetyltransferase